MYRSRFRSSITRLSVDDKALRSKEVSTQERDLLLNKGSSLVSESIPERKGLLRGNGDSDASNSDIGMKSKRPLVCVMCSSFVLP